MGFCRRCGDIVVGARCKCGGTAVAAVVKWGHDGAQEKVQTQDRWSKTYVSHDKSPTRSEVESQSTGSSSSTASTKRFPRPLSQSSASSSHPISSRVTAHITSTTSYNRPPSPLKNSIAVPESGILPVPHTSSLAKVYGSVLQPKESLATYSCAICSNIFPPDATIYPDPSSTSNNRFLCRTCFVTNGGSQGTCPECNRAVLSIKSEGSFVSAAGKVWHKRCFRCVGCDKDIGNTPMVDLLGKPSCAECFDTCLNRDSTPQKKKWDSPRGSPSMNNLGGLRIKGKEEGVAGSPAVDELEARLGITKSREGSPTLEELSNRLSMIGRTNSTPSGSPKRRSTTTPTTDGSRGRSSGMGSSTSSPTPFRKYSSPIIEKSKTTSPTRYSGGSGNASPIRYSHTGNKSPKPTEEAIEQMKQRFLRSASASPSPTRVSTPSRSSQSQRRSRSRSASRPRTPSGASSSMSSDDSSRAYSADGSSSAYTDTDTDTDTSLIRRYPRGISPMPDLMSDSDMTTESSGPNSPPRNEDMDPDVDVFGQGTIRASARGRRVSRGITSTWDEDSESYTTPTKIVPKSPSYPRTSTTPTKFNVGSPKVSSSPASQTRPARPTLSTVDSNASCIRCHELLFNLRSSRSGVGNYVTVPGTDGRDETYHAHCFRCYVCDEAFGGGEQTQAAFVRGPGGACHLECAPVEKVKIRPKSMSSTTSIFSSKPHTTTYTRPVSTYTTPLSSASSTSSSSRYTQGPLTAPGSATSMTFPRFGSSTACPGCHKSVSPMERGVVPGPQGTRWHTGCLVCGGKKDSVKGRGWVKDERKKGEPGCGKRLDSAAKSDADGDVWCRECLLLLPTNLRGESPTRMSSAVMPNHTGGSGPFLVKVAPQYTGTTTLARQFTGSTEGALLRQLTGARSPSPTRRSASPTKGIFDRSISPTKQLMTRQRPKSVIGMRGKSIDEGRGMFLVRQMTGGLSGTETE